MKLIRKYIWLFISVTVIAVITFAYYEYNRKPANLIDVKATATVDAAELVKLYEEDESKANTLYLGKPIDVTGIISDIHNQQDTLVNIMLGKKDDMHRVSCLLDVLHTIKAGKFNIGAKVTVRGICTGYLLDVELNRCVIIR